MLGAVFNVLAAVRGSWYLQKTIFYILGVSLNIIFTANAVKEYKHTSALSKTNSSVGLISLHKVQWNGREAGTNKCKNLLSSLWKCSWTRVKTVPTDVIYSFNWFKWFVVSCSLCQKILQCLLELYVRSTFPWTIWVNIYSTASSFAMSLHQSVLLLFLVGQRMSDSEFNYPAGHILWVTTGY